MLFIARVYWDEGLPLEFVDNEVVERAFIISGISEKYSAFAGTVDALEFFNELTGSGSVLDIVGQGKLNKGYSFFRYDDMSAVPPEEDEVIFFTADGLVRVITESSVRIMFGLAMFIARVSFRVFEVVFPGSGHDGFRVDDKDIIRDDVFI